MNSELRTRVILPIILPIAVLTTVAAAIGGIAMVLLYTTRGLALLIAILVAMGVMVAMSLANSIDEADMTMGRKGVITLAAVLPLIVGAGVSVWSVGGGVPEADLNINRLPHVSAPEGAVVAAQNSQSFCHESEDGAACSDTTELTLPAQPESESFLFLFENLESGVSHNFTIFQLGGDASAPAPGEVIFGVAEGADIIEGGTSKLYEVPAAADEFAVGNQFFYNCVVHPAMSGVLTIVEPAA